MTAAGATAGRPGLWPALLRFGATGSVSVGLDVVLLTLLHGLLGVHLVVATSLAYVSSLGVNYGLNHAWVFRAAGDHRRRLVRYGSLVAVNATTTVLGVAGLAALGLYYLVAKALVVALNAVLNFTCFRAWVFR